MKSKMQYRLPEMQVISVEDNDVLTSSGFVGEEDLLGTGADE